MTKYLYFLKKNFSLKTRKIPNLESLKKGHGFSEVVSPIIECISWKKVAYNYSQKNNRELATLLMGTCFGEGTLIRGKKHNNSALALEDCLLRTIDEEIIEKNLKSETPLVQLILYMVLRRAEFMNSLRMADDFSKK